MLIGGQPAGKGAACDGISRSRGDRRGWTLLSQEEPMSPEPALSPRRPHLLHRYPSRTPSLPSANLILSWARHSCSNGIGWGLNLLSLGPLVRRGSLGLGVRDLALDSQLCLFPASGHASGPRFAQPYALVVGPWGSSISWLTWT